MCRRGGAWPPHGLVLGHAILFVPIWGRISHRIGRRPILLVGLVGSVLFYLLFGYASDLPAAEAALALTLLFVSRIGAGVAGASIATAQAVIADCTTPERRKHGMALIGAAFGIGFTFGPLVGFASLFWFPEHHGVIGYSAAGLSLLALLLGIVLLPETRHFEEAPPLQRRWLDWRTVRGGAEPAGPGSGRVGLLSGHFWLRQLRADPGLAHQGFAGFGRTR